LRRQAVAAAGFVLLLFAFRAIVLFGTSVATPFAVRMRHLTNDARPSRDRGLHADVLQFAHLAGRRKKRSDSIVVL
jgi:hypothetical protein